MGLRIELSELKRISSRSHDVNEELNSDLNRMATLLEQICTNVNSSELTEKNKNLVDAINGIGEKVRTNFPTIISFLDTQVDNYEKTNINTKEKIESLVSSIDETFKL